MDYGSILSNAWNIIWKKKFLFIVGILSILGAGGGLGGLSYAINPSQLTQSFKVYEQMGRGPSISPNEIQTIEMAIMIAGIVSVVLGIALWFNSRISTGGLIAGVSKRGEEEITGFKAAWMAGWERRWPMFGLGLLVLIPTWIFTVPMNFLSSALQRQQMELTANPRALGPEYFSSSLGVCGLVCAMLFVIVPLYLFQTIAERASVLEGLTFSASISRAWQIVRQKIGAIVVLCLIQIGIGLGVGVVAGIFVCVFSACLGFLSAMSSPWMVSLSVLIIVPVVWVFSGMMQTYFSAVWTTAWNEWANEVPPSSPALEVSATLG